MANKRIDEYSTDPSVTGTEFLLLQDPSTLAYSKATVADAAPVRSVNGKNGTVTISGVGNVSVDDSGGDIVISGAASWYSGTPAESPDGSRTTFTVPAAYVAGGLVVFLNGLRESNFTETTTTTFTMSEPPVIGDELMLLYRTN